MQVNIKRFEHGDVDGTRGVVLIDGKFFGFSIECPDHYNLPFVSRIQAGTYRAYRTETEHHGDCFIIQNVPCRYGIILFHKGNTKKDFSGCIGVGNSLHNFYFDNVKYRGVTNTARQCAEFMTLAGDLKQLTVVIEDC